jgi:predicted transposase YbfD/YdcC
MQVPRLGIRDFFKQIPDPRNDSGKRHLLEDILSITVLAVICGADDWQSIEDYGRSQEDFLKQFLVLPHGVPSNDTYRRVFIALDSQVFEHVFLEWTKSLVSRLSGVDIIPIDGKTLRRSYKKGDTKSAVHMVSAWSNANHLVLGQLKVDGKSNEIKAIPQLLDMLFLKGSVVTIDAMGCQRDIAEKIIEKEADYILAVKGNQGALEDQLQNLFKIRTSDDHHEQVDGGHSRIEIRQCDTIEQLEWLDESEKWKGLQSIIKVEATRDIEGKIAAETRYYISSLKSTAAFFNTAVRQHWGIENSLHWVLDMAFSEDDCRKRKGNEAENFAIIRRFAFNLLKRDSSVRLGVKNKRLKAGWDRPYLLHLLMG